jgi:hypothetical protein
MTVMICVVIIRVMALYSLVGCQHLLLTQYCAGDKIEKNEMGRACGTYGGGEGGV